MRHTLNMLSLPIAAIAILVGFQLWGQHSRAREWWWVGGDAKGMSFVDLASEEAGVGHLLLTETRRTEDGDAQEIELHWSCLHHTVALGEMWKLDANMAQLGRVPPPPGPQAGPRAPREGAEAAALRVACASIETRSKMPTIRIEREPVRVNRLADELIKLGLRPFDALILSSYSPSRDPEGYERLLIRVPDAQRPLVRNLTQ